MEKYHRNNKKKSTDPLNVFEEVHPKNIHELHPEQARLTVSYAKLLWVHGEGNACFFEN